MSLPLEQGMKFGVQTRLPTPNLARKTVETLDRLDFDSIWVGDHIAFTSPILDPFVQLAHAAAYSKRLTFGTGVYLLPMRHAGPVAKQAGSLDHLTEGRFIFGVGLGGEFPNEWALAGVPTSERGARMDEAIPVLRKLWRGEPVSHEGRFYSFPEVHMQPASYQEGGPPIWCGGRTDAALRRAGELADGYYSYVVTPEMFAGALEKIEAAADVASRNLTSYGTGHLLFCCIRDSYEEALDRATELLSERYAMDFREPAKRYCALGTPEDIAEKIAAFHAAGVRHIVVDFLGFQPERLEATERFGVEIRPLLKNL